MRYKDKVDKERIKTEKALKESEKKYSMLFKSGSDAVILVDAKTLRLLDGNRAAQHLYGYSRKELLKLDVTDLSLEPEKTKRIIQKGVETAIPIRYHKKKDGAVFPVEIRTNFFKLNNRKINIGNIRDISERVKAEKEKKELQSRLLNSQKMEAIGQLAAGVAHEINNPVGFVGSNLEALNDYMKNIEVLLQHYGRLGNMLKDFNQEYLSDEIKGQIQMISKYEKDIEIDYIREDIPELLHDCKDGTDQIGSVVGDLKSFAHPGKDRQMAVDINKGLESTLNIVNNELKYKAEVIKNFGKIPMVDGYPQKLNQVFMNFVINAAQAIKEKGEIKIQTKKDEQNVIVTISDTGCGIEKKNLSKIFDPFFTTKDVGKGTGLGMNISYNIIQEHKGTIDVQSQVGKGTTFTIKLPGKI
ncbi:MAG: ATP-binding protein [Desulfobacula sp.]|nr:ATP-binding protein [Desulfobacula sp.]